MEERQRLEYGLEPPVELFDLAASIRNVMERMLVIDEAHEELQRASREIEDIARRLEAIGRKGLHARMSPAIDPGPDDLRPYYAGDAARWHYNPIFPAIELAEIDGGGVLRGTVRCGLVYEGPPGCVHGGVVAMLLDQLLGQVNLEHGVPAMTGSLSVRYRRPTPLLTELSLEAHPPEQLEGRKYVTRGWIRHDGAVTAEAEGIFVRPSFEKPAELPHLKEDHARALQAEMESQRKR